MTRNAAQTSLSLPALLVTVLVGVYAALRFSNIALQIVPSSAVVTTVVFLLVALYWALDLWPHDQSTPHPRLELSKTAVLWLIIALMVILPTLLMVIASATVTAPHSFMHDGAVQTRAAVNFLLEGRNPYAENYLATPLANWPVPFPELTENPALYHFVYLPVAFLLPLPFQALWPAFDQRLLFLVFLVAVLVLGSQLMPSHTHRRLWIIIVALNPLFVAPFIEGRNDIILLFAVIVMVVCLTHQRPIAAALALALACATKQLAWPLVPFAFLFIAGAGDLRTRLTRALPAGVVFTLAFSLLILPFLLWDAPAFIDDTFTYVAGGGSTSFPIAGFGFSALLVETGLVASSTAAFPHSLLQISLTLPILIVLSLRQLQANTLANLLLHYALVLFVFTFFSRIFFDNYLGYITTLFATSTALAQTPPTHAQ